MKSEKIISRNFTDEILKSMAEADKKSIYQNPYAGFEYNDYKKSRPTDIVLNMDNGHSIDEMPMSKAGGESIYETPYTYHRYDDYGKSRSAEKLSIPNDQDESIYEDPYSTNIYNVYVNYSPTKISHYAILKNKAKRKWLFLFLVALSVIGALVVGLSIHFTKVTRKNVGKLVPDSRSG